MVIGKFITSDPDRPGVSGKLCILPVYHFGASMNLFNASVYRFETLARPDRAEKLRGMVKKIQERIKMIWERVKTIQVLDKKIHLRVEKLPERAEKLRDDAGSFDGQGGCRKFQF